MAEITDGASWFEDQDEIIGEICEVFDRHGSNVFEAYRALTILQKASAEQVVSVCEELSSDLDTVIKALEGANEALAEATEAG